MGKKLKNMTDTNLLLTITIVVFFAMYIGAIVFQGKGFLKPQTFFNILNANAALIILSCGMSLVMITGGIDISVGGVVALVSMSCAVYLDFGGGNVFISMLIAVAIGLAFGIVQGFLVAYLDIQPFIVTLAGMFYVADYGIVGCTEGDTCVRSGDGICEQAGKLCKCLCGNRCDSSTDGSHSDVCHAPLDEDGPQFLCCGRQQPECTDAGHQC